MPAERRGAPAGPPPAPGYLFYGADLYPAELFLADLLDRLVPDGSEAPVVERSRLEETSWTAILDEARTAPFLFAPWRILVVTTPAPKKGGKEPKDAGGGKGKGRARSISEADEKRLKAYFEDPAPRTVLIVEHPVEKKDSALVKIFASIKNVELVECKPLREYEAPRWIQDAAARLKRQLAPGADKRLIEVAGYDRRRLEQELRKLDAFKPAPAPIGPADVDEVVAWTRPAGAFDLEEALEDGDIGKAVVVLNAMMQEGEDDIAIVARLTTFLKNLFLAKVRLKEGRDEREVFRSIKPYITESMGMFYRRKFDAFIGLVKGLSDADLRRLLGSLRRVDRQIKTASPSSPQAWLEGFLIEFGKAREARRVTSRPAARA